MANLFFSRRFSIFLLIGTAFIGTSVSDLAMSAEETGFPVLGDPDAPVTMIEYSSLSCPHCAAFHADTLPQIKETYIDTGKVKLEFRDFPLNQSALVGSVVAHCDRDRFFPFLEVLFSNQRQWASKSDPVAAVRPIARLGGLSDSQLDACMADQELQERILDARIKGQDEHEVASTPTFVIAGETISGNHDFDVFAEAIDAALASN
ncbi:MAG: DsbA family protein [Geminicoccaceae bacterium]